MSLQATQHIKIHKEKVFGLGQPELSIGSRQKGQGKQREGKCVAMWPVAEPGPSQDLPGVGEDSRTELRLPFLPKGVKNHISSQENAISSLHLNCFGAISLESPSQLSRSQLRSLQLSPPT